MLTDTQQLRCDLFSNTVMAKTAYTIDELQKAFDWIMEGKVAQNSSTEELKNV